MLDGYIMKLQILNQLYCKYKKKLQIQIKIQIYLRAADAMTSKNITWKKFLDKIVRKRYSS